MLEIIFKVGGSFQAVKSDAEISKISWGFFPIAKEKIPYSNVTFCMVFHVNYPFFL